jgi:hypothetical protein
VNVHVPERQPNESRDVYVLRRKRSHDINRRNGKPENWQPETRQWGSFVQSTPMAALLNGDPLPKLKKRKSRKVKA